MSERYQRPDYIRVVKAVCVEFGNNDDTWTWCYLDVREALTKAEDRTLPPPVKIWLPNTYGLSYS